MQQAIDLALEGVRTHHGGPFGALIVRGKDVIASGFNRVTSSHDPTAHAEIVAIRAACQKLGSFKLDGCELYTSCEPCPMCLAAIYWAHIERVFYACERSDAARAGFDDAFLYDELGKSIAERKLPLVPLMRDAALKAFQTWLDKPDRTLY